MKQIMPCLWFDTQTEEAFALYSSVIPNSQTLSIQRYPDQGLPDFMLDKAGKVLTGVFELGGQRLMALDGGPDFKFNPSESLFYNASSVEEVERVWNALLPGGQVFMPLGEYPFSPRFGWLSDKFGLSWQIHMGERPQKINPFLMFVKDQCGKAEEAIRLYMSLIDNSQLTHIEYYTEADAANGEKVGTVKHVDFTLNGHPFMALDSGLAHEFNFNEAFSLVVECETQQEIDRLWNALSVVPESEQCGWLKDKYGLSWQIVPTVLGELMSDPDSEKVMRTTQALLQMKKLDIEALKRAHAGS